MSAITITRNVTVNGSRGKWVIPMGTEGTIVTDYPDGIIADINGSQVALAKGDYKRA